MPRTRINPGSGSKLGGAVLGLDLSTRAAGAVAVPLDWGGDWARVHSVVVGEELARDATDAQRAFRTGLIASRLVAFAKANRVRDVWIEGYAFGMRTMAHTLGEVGGVVRLELVRAGFQIHTANMGSLRKLLLGTAPRKGAKEAVVAALKAAGGVFETVDEYEAFACANYGLAETGGFFYGQAAIPKPRKPAIIRACPAPASLPALGASQARPKPQPSKPPPKPRKARQLPAQAGASLALDQHPDPEFRMRAAMNELALLPKRYAESQQEKLQAIGEHLATPPKRRRPKA